MPIRSNLTHHVSVIAIIITLGVVVQQYTVKHCVKYIL